METLEELLDALGEQLRDGWAEDTWELGLQ
jgi:hypothetical protein